MWNQKASSQPLAEYINMDVESNQDEDSIKTLCAKAQNERVRFIHKIKRSLQRYRLWFHHVNLLKWQNERVWGPMLEQWVWCCHHRKIVYSFGLEIMHTRDKALFTMGSQLWNKYNSPIRRAFLIRKATLINACEQFLSIYNRSYGPYCSMP